MVYYWRGGYMKKIILVALLLLVGCSSGTSLYNEKESEQLKKLGVYDAVASCENSDSVKIMLQDNAFDKQYAKAYCGLQIKSSDGVNELLRANLDAKDVQTYLSLPNFHAQKVTRYLAYDAKTIKAKVREVNMDMDLAPYSKTNIIHDDRDMALLINKFNALPEGYIPQDLVDINYACQQGVDYSCSTMDRMQLRQEAAKAYEKFAAAAQKEGLDIVAIAAYRSYEYQQGLYDYNKNLNGQEYADMYYARPGQSEHNSGLAIDITFNGHPYNEIEAYEGYDWILNNMHKYGFILRYPEDKQEVTRYGYESWHMRYVGKKVAKEIYENKWCLEEYYGEK